MAIVSFKRKDNQILLTIPNKIRIISILFNKYQYHGIPCRALAEEPCDKKKKPTPSGAG